MIPTFTLTRLIIKNLHDYTKVDIDRYKKKKKVGRNTFGMSKEVIDDLQNVYLVYRSKISTKLNEIQSIMNTMRTYLSLSHPNFIKCQGYDYKQKQGGVKFYLVFEYNNISPFMEYFSKIPKPYPDVVWENLISSLMSIFLYMNFYDIGRPLLAYENMVVKDHRFLLIDLEGSSSKELAAPENNMHNGSNTKHNGNVFKEAVFSAGLLLLKILMNVPITGLNTLTKENFEKTIEKIFRPYKNSDGKYQDLIQLLSKFLIYEPEKRNDFVEICFNDKIMQKNIFIQDEDLIKQIAFLKQFQAENKQNGSQRASLNNFGVLTRNELKINNDVDKGDDEMGSLLTETSENRTQEVDSFIFAREGVPIHDKQVFEDKILEQNKGLILENRNPYKYDNGAVYQGQWKGKAKHGMGILKWPNGTKYEGEWKDNKMNGHGHITYANGDQYIGEWKDNMAHGTGIYKSILNATYEGSWKNDYPDGVGVETWLNGSRYQGEYKQGKKHGKGTNYFSDGSVYKGMFENDKLNGVGKYEWTDGSEYDGEWKNSYMHGYGIYKWPDGTKYEGKYFKGKKHGYGVYTWADGRIYQGHWVEGIQHGTAKYLDRKNKWREGLWKNGKRIKWLNLANFMPNSLINIIYKDRHIDNLNPSS